MALRDQLRRLKRAAEKDMVLIRLRDGTTRVFTDLECWKQKFLAQMDLFKGEARTSEVLEAVRAATPESRKAFEDKYGSIQMEAQVIAPEKDGGWVEVYKLTEAGEVEYVRHEGHTEEAKRLLEEARQGASFY